MWFWLNQLWCVSFTSPKESYSSLPFLFLVQIVLLTIFFLPHHGSYPRVTCVTYQWRGRALCFEIIPLIGKAKTKKFQVRDRVFLWWSCPQSVIFDCNRPQCLLELILMFCFLVTNFRLTVRWNSIVWIPFPSWCPAYYRKSCLHYTCFFLLSLLSWIQQ